MPRLLQTPCPSPQKPGLRSLDLPARSGLRRRDVQSSHRPETTNLTEKLLKPKTKRAFPHQVPLTQVGQGLLVGDMVEERLGRVSVWVDGLACRLLGLE